MGEIIQHIPNFTHGVEPKTATFKTIKELLEIEWVKSWSKDLGFYFFSWDYYANVKLLLAEFLKGEQWWVVGKIINDEEKIVEKGLHKWVGSRRNIGLHYPQC